MDEKRSVTRRGFLIGGAAIAAVAIPAEQANAATGHVEAAASPHALTAVSIAQGDLDKGIVIATPGRFPGIDPTGAASSVAGLQAAINATPEGSTLVIPAGTYLMDAEIYPHLAKSMSVVAYGAQFLQTTAKPIFSVSGDYGTPVKVISYSTPSLTGLSPTTKLVMAGATGWSAGDVIKIVSDDVIPEGRPGSGDGTESRLGEFATVRNSTNSNVYLNGVLREKYSTNIRAALISDQTFSIEGGEYRTVDSRMSTVNSPLIYLGKLLSPRLKNVTVSRAGGCAIQFSSCFGYLAENTHVAYAVDNAANNQYGYGILDCGSSHGTVSGGVFRFVRHSYTDDTSRIPANSPDLIGYGRTYGAKVIGVHALMTTNNSFDTHHCSEGTEFIGCTATSGVNQGSGQFGFQLRGINHRVIGCSAVGTDGGLQVLNETGGGDSRGHFVSDLQVRDVRGPAIRMSVRPVGHPQAGLRDDNNIDIRGLRADNTDSMIISYNATLRMSDAVWVAPAGVAGANVTGIFGDNSEIVLTDVVLDYEQNTAGTPRVISAGTTASTTPGNLNTELRDIEVRANANVVARAFGLTSGSNHTTIGQGVRVTYPFKSMPGDGLTDDSMMGWKSDYIPGLTVKSSSSANFTFVNADLTATMTKLVQSPDPMLFVAMKPTNTLTTVAFPPGRVMGQQILFVHEGAKNSTFKNGAAFLTALAGNVDKVLAPGGQLCVVWDGSIWRERV